MRPVNPSNMHNQSVSMAQKELFEQKHKPAEAPANNVDSGSVNAPEDIVTLSTAQTAEIRHVLSMPSIPVSHEEMKALYKTFSVKV